MGWPYDSFDRLLFFLQHVHIVHCPRAARMYCNGHRSLGANVLGEQVLGIQRKMLTKMIFISSKSTNAMLFLIFGGWNHIQRVHNILVSVSQSVCPPNVRLLIWMLFPLVLKAQAVRGPVSVITQEILNLKGHQLCMNGSKVTTIFPSKQFGRPITKRFLTEK